MSQADPSPSDLLAMSQEDFDAYARSKMIGDMGDDLHAIEHAHINRCLDTAVDFSFSDIQNPSEVIAIEAFAAKCVEAARSPVVRRGPRRHKRSLRAGLSAHDLASNMRRARLAYWQSERISALRAIGTSDFETLKKREIPNRKLVLDRRRRQRQPAIGDKVFVLILSETWENPGASHRSGPFTEYVNELLRLVDPARWWAIEPGTIRKYIKKQKRTEEN